MRILIDLQGAQNGSRYRGIGRYSTALAKAIARNAGDHKIFILLNGLFPETIDEIRTSFSGLIPSHHFIIFSAPGPADELPIANSWRVRAAELARERVIDDLAPDLLLVSSLFEGANDNTVTSIGKIDSSVPVAVILYDLIPFLDPEKYIGYPEAKAWYYGKIESLKRADLLLAISNSAGREAIDALGVEPRRVVNIMSAADEFFSNIKQSTGGSAVVLRRYGIKRKFLMHSSAFDERKNFEGLIQAFGTLPKKLRKAHQLVLVCKIDEAGRKKLNAVGATAGLDPDDLVLTGYVSDDDLVTLYSSCHLFVFPSLHEGFGLPALEAMCCGVAVIGSNTSSVPEVIGREDALFDPKSIESMSALIKRALTDSAYWGSLKEHAVVQAKKFSWGKSAKLALAGFESLYQVLQGSVVQNNKQCRYGKFISEISLIKSTAPPSEDDLVATAKAIYENENSVRQLKSLAGYSGRLIWRVEGPFDSTYSLALLNRETARALMQLGHFPVLHSTEGPGDFPPNPAFLKLNPDLAEMHARVNDYPHSAVQVASRNLYPPRVNDMASPLNLLHHYAWEESGFPAEWVDNFNRHLNGITTLSQHVEKILVDNGISVPMITSGCGVDHWERIQTASNYHLKAKSFRFLHVSSCFPRKGVELLLDAYEKSFTADDDVSLVIKTFENPHNEIHKWLKTRLERNSRFPQVSIIEGDLSDSELKALYCQCHALVAPSRAEGFGLPMAEAMLTGLPVITTAWGGQLDFCNEQTAWLVDYKFKRAKTHFGLFASVWAEADTDALAESLKEVFTSTREERERKTRAGRRLLLENFTWKDVVGRAVTAAHKWQKFPGKRPQPRIGWLSSWNTKCGIATYSERLISGIPQDVVVLAAHQDHRLRTDEPNCVRCWNTGKEQNNLNEVANTIEERQLNVVVIQFNYGFFNFFELSDFIDRQLRERRVVIVMMHSTSDPAEFKDKPNWQLAQLRSVFSRCHRLLVHSVIDLNRLKNLGLVDNVSLFPHGVVNYEVAGPGTSTNKLPLVAAYGFCLPHKGLIELVDAIDLLRKKGKPVRLRLVNAEYPAPSSAELVQKLRHRIDACGLNEFVELHANYLEDKQSLALLNEADLLVFPYQQTGESSSAAVRSGLASRRPVAVTPLDIFDDVGNAAFRFSGTTPGDIAQGIAEFVDDLSKNSERAKLVAKEAELWRQQHDFAGLSKRLHNMFVALLRKNPSCAYAFNGSSRSFHTQVGSIQGRCMSSTGRAGYLLFGLYMPLKAGVYKVTISGSVGEVSGARVDVTANHGRHILAEAPIAPTNEHERLATLVASVSSACEDFEVRVWVGEHSKLSVSQVEVEPIS